MSKESMSVRHLEVDLSQGFPRYWNGGDAYRTHLFNALSMLFPHGEQGFIDAVKGCLDRLPAQGCDELRQDVKLFIGQEATHRQQHKRFNDELARQGYRSVVDRYLEKSIAWGFQNLSPLTNLAGTAAYEHFTAVLGDGLLRRKSWTRDMTEPMRQLWQWHAAEEAEHKAVAMDVYRAAGGHERGRAIAFIVTLFEFIVLVNIQCGSMLWHDGKLFSPRTWWSALTLWWGREGIVWHVLPRLFKFLKPGFHPWQDDNRQLLTEWRAASSGQYRVITAGESGLAR